MLGKAGVSAREFAMLLRLNPNSITNYAKKGCVPSHLAIIVSLMAEMAEKSVDYRAVLNSIELNEKKPRGKSLEKSNVESND